MQSLFSTITNANFDAEYFKKRIEQGKKLVGISNDEITNNSGILKEENQDIISLKELITYGLKGMCAYLDHAYLLGYKDNEIFQFIREALVATLRDKSADELTALVLK